MNLILTTSCNKGCSFCFAKNVLDKNEMSLEDIKTLVNKSDDSIPITLLGGEPTLNSNFIEILQYLKTVPNAVTLISNFLFNEKTVDAIIDFKKEKDIRFLINTSEVNDNMFKITSENMLKIFDENDTSSCKLGYTIMLEKGFSYYEENLNKYKNILKNRFSFARISLPLPNPSIENEMYFYKKYEYIDIMVDMIKWGMKNNVKFNLDCGIYPCMMKDNNTEEFLMNWLGKTSYGCETGIPVDVINTHEVQYCYPGERVRVNIDKHSNISTVYNELKLRKDLEYSIKKLPNECENCEFLFNKCPGPCLGFLKEK